MRQQSSTLIPGAYVGRLLILESLPSRRNARGKSYRYIRARCDCGTVVDVRVIDVASGNTSSCGCLRREMTSARRTVHGGSKSRLYDTWLNMKRRCYDPESRNFSHYGKRGIGVDPTWMSFEVFSVWAISAGYIDSLTIERINIDRDYMPDNCRFIPHADQQLNTSRSAKVTAWGETKVVSQWAVDPRCAVRQATLAKRIRSGWPPEQAILTEAAARNARP